MSDSAPHSDAADGDADNPLVLSAQLEEREKYTPRWTPLLSPLQTFIGLLPSHKNTRKGRRTAKQLKLLVAVVAFGLLVFAESAWAIVVGVVFLGLAPLLPLPQVQKRAWLNRLKKLREPRERSVAAPAKVRFDGRRVVLERDGDNLRRVLVDRDEHEIAAGSANGRLYLKVAPTSGKRSETIWIGTDELDTDDLPDDWEPQDFDEDAIDAPTLVDGPNWRSLAEHLHE